LRCALLKQQRQLSYEELAFHLEDSASFRAFARLPQTALFASAAPLVPPERPTRSREGLAVRNPLSSTGESLARGTPAPSGENPAPQRLVEILRGIWTPDIVTAF
jgi:hypothetical protein